MNSTKCTHCGLVNALADTTCRRCGEGIGGRSSSKNSPRSPREAAKKSSWLYTILFLTLISAAAYYLVSGVEKSYEDIKTSEVNRIATQPKPQSDGTNSRSESDQKRAGNYKNAIQNSPGLAESQKRLEETQKLMQPDQNKERK